jgi:hypothetical protein
MSPARDPVPQRLERELLALYELELELGVAAVLTSDRACLDSHLAPSARRPAEVLLVRQDADGLLLFLNLQSYEHHIMTQ